MITGKLRIDYKSIERKFKEAEKRAKERITSERGSSSPPPKEVKKG